ncbi:MAG: YjgN family protein [Porticoccaceae bacterium]
MQALRFEGSGFEYFKIWIVNVLLILITLGLYYPWAKVRNHRYFYANSTLEGRNFEYHATGKQLFVGYLIAMALFITYVIIQNISPVGSMVVLLVFLLALPWIIWRSLKFNFRMTSFSNVRFSFEEGVGGAYVNYMLLPVACFLALYIGPITMAILLPALGESAISGMTGVFIAVGIIISLVLAVYLFAFMKKKNTRYMVGGCRYGQGHFSTDVETKGFMTILLKTIGLSLLSIFLFALLAGVIVSVTVGLEALMGIQQGMSDPEAMGEIMSGGALPVILGSVYLGFIVLTFIIIAYSYTRQRTYIYANSTLDENINFASTLKMSSLAWVMTSNFFAVILSLGLALAWAKVRMARLILENTQVNTAAGFEQYITQKQQEQSSLGEQIGDAFDVDVGIGF